MKLWAIVPELLLGGLCLVLVPLAAFCRGPRRVLPLYAAVLGLVLTMAATSRMAGWEPVSAFEHTYAVDGLACALKLFIELGALVTLALVGSYFRGEEALGHAAVAVVFATLGAVGLVSSMDIALVVIFIQMMSVASYVLVTLCRRDQAAEEASLKYFLFGAVALAVMAYGLSFFFGLGASLDFARMGRVLGGADPMWVAVAFLMALVGYGFELMIVPVHFWGPDVLAGTSAPVAGFLSVVPKIGAFGGLLRLLVHALPNEIGGWPFVVALVAVVSMTVGNLTALGQTRLKRLFAWSSVAQSGYILMAVAVVGRRQDALFAIGFYLGAYLFMNLCVFAVVAEVEKASGADTIEAIRGLGERAPGVGVAMSLALLSLAGIPPLAGFAGKVLLFGEAIAGGMAWLAVAGAINMAIALYYYVKVIAAMFFFRPVEGQRRPARGPGYAVAVFGTALGTLVFGVLPELLFDWTLRMANLLR